MKNYISFINDHSGSMASLANAAKEDFNANITAVKEAATREMLDTVVSVAEVGLNDGFPISVMVSNPHVLKPKTNWPTPGGTPLWSVTLNLLKMLVALPDANRDTVSFLVMMTTDGQATDGEQARLRLKEAMQPLVASGRWSFVVRVPAGASKHYHNQLIDLGISEGNIQEWDTTVAGMAASTQKTTQAMGQFFSQRSTGVKASGSFYADASQVNLAALEELPQKEYSLYVVPAVDNGIEIRPFILRHRMEHLYGSAFYQLTKTEPKVQHNKQVLVRDRATGKVFHGKSARSMIGLPDDRNARLHPGDHKNFDIFIQSNSINRKLVGGTGVLYWKSIGRPFTEADTAYLQPKATPAPGPVVLPAVAPTNKPTKSPIPVTARVQYFETREDARMYCNANGIKQTRIEKNSGSVTKATRWFIK